ncbi:MAG: phytoene/squalene synthase family protein [Candidatus Omnitrophica bacterium]|nr:phytoene/squalene synthase family protein [Candidatus Omnitrophota bacterium]
MNKHDEYRLLRTGYLEAKNVTKIHSHSFYYASLILPPRIQKAAYSIYAVCRLSDEAIDSSSPQSQVAGLNKIREKVAHAYSHKTIADPLGIVFQKTVRDYHIPQEYFNVLFTGMIADLTKNRYKNFNELYDYCYEIAGIVGLMMLSIFEYTSPEAKKYAVDLGIAMQLTNIIRDIKEDWERGRVYLPQDEMSRFNISEDTLREGRVTPDFKAFMQFQIQRAREYYTNAAKGIPLLKGKRVRFVSMAMTEFYKEILTVIEKKGYDIFSGRAYTTAAQKTVITLKILGKAIR